MLQLQEVFTQLFILQKNINLKNLIVENTNQGPAWLQKIGQNGTYATSKIEFRTTGK